MVQKLVLLTTTPITRAMMKTAHNMNDWASKNVSKLTLLSSGLFLCLVD
jgi:hypothetical protein